jgi:Fe-S cluster assembly protein SufD
MSQILTKQDIVNIYKNENSIASNNAKYLALEYLNSNDLPNLKSEEWRKTDLKELLKHNFEFKRKIEIDSNVVNLYNLSGNKANILVFVNGFFNKDLSKIIDSNDIAIIDSIANQINNENFLKNFNKTEVHSLHYFSAINTAYANDGAFILIKKNSKLEHPVQIYNFSNGNNVKTASLIRNLIIAQSGSKADIIMSFHALSEDYFLTNSVTEIILEENSSVDLNVFQGEGNDAFEINSVKVIQEKGSQFFSNTYTMCGRIVRNDLHVKISGENCYTELNGLYLPDREQHFDNNIFIDHNVGHSQSNQFYRGILDNNATSVFTGKVHINKLAEKTNAFQKNNNILLSKQAKIHSKPQLIIDNDDVSASHGSTVGQLNKEALFYMQSRGIGKEQAQTLLLTAFANEILNKIKVQQFFNYISYYVEKRLKGDKTEGLCSKMGICRG